MKTRYRKHSRNPAPSNAAASKLLELAELGNNNFRIHPGIIRALNTALDKGVLEYYSENKLIITLGPQGLTRSNRRTPFPGAENSRNGSSYEIVLQFADNMQRPSKLSFCFYSRRVSVFMEAPHRCYRCQKFGRLAANCKAQTDSRSHCMRRL